MRGALADPLLDQLWSSFGHGLDGCERELLSYVLDVARRLTVPPEGLGALLADDVVLLSADLLFLYWLDDRFERLAKAESLAPIERRALESQDLFVLGGSAWESLRRMYVHRFEGNVEDLRYWTATAEAVYGAYRTEALVDVGRIEMPSYSRYLRTGGVSSAWAHALAALGLFYQQGLGRSRCDVSFSSVVSDSAVAVRLHNDLASYKMEVEEGSRANAIAVLSRWLDHEAARAFVERELRTYDSLVRHAAALSFTDSERFACKAYLVLIRAVDALHKSDAYRYDLVDMRPA